MRKKILFVFGTRPEGIKMAPLIKEFQKNDDTFEVKLCITAQHREMLDQVMNFFKINADYDLNLMKSGQTLTEITSRVLSHIEPILRKEEPDLVFVQGDTTTVMASAIAAFYQQIPVAHLEAGLRSGNKLSPFPEEMNRVITGHIASWHFTPTKRATDNLGRENITQNVYQVGNTVIDALILALSIIKTHGENAYKDYFRFLNLEKKIILITGHRRESFGKPFENICMAIRTIAEEYPDVELVYPVHLNPNVQKPVNTYLSGIDNIKLISPLEYPYLIWLMSRSYLVLTDSGGIQEEAPTLGKPVLVMRDVTERQEGIEANTARLVGTEKDVIIREIRRLLDDSKHYSAMANAVNPYGDGQAAKKIVAILKEKM